MGLPLPTVPVSQDFFIDVSAAADRDGVWDEIRDEQRQEQKRKRIRSGCHPDLVYYYLILLVI